MTEPTFRADERSDVAQAARHVRCQKADLTFLHEELFGHAGVLVHESPSIPLDKFSALVEFVAVKATKSHKDQQGPQPLALYHRFDGTRFHPISVSFHK